MAAFNAVTTKSPPRFLQDRASTMALLFSDLSTCALSFFAAYYLRNGLIEPEIQPLAVYLPALPAVLLLLLAVFSLFGLYHPKVRLTRISELYTVTRALALLIVLVMAASFLNKYDYSRAAVLFFWGLSTFFINFGRVIVHAVQKRLIAKGIGLTRIAIIGTGKPARKLQKSLERFAHLGFKVCEIIPGALISTLPEIIARKGIAEVYIADPSLSHDQILTTIAACGDTSARIRIASGLFSIIGGNGDLYDLEGIPAIDTRKNSPGVLHRLAKRSMDICGAVIGFALLWPLFLLIIMIIRLNSAGPAIFSHERVGRDGKKFVLYKFRTMYQDVKRQELAPSSPSDPRITPIGRWLRKTSLDELPQLWNVLKGDMSLVGPRPEMPFIVETYNQWQSQRLKARPGITGLWQILGRKDLPLHENLEYDLYYINNQSLLLDLVILLKTMGVVIKAKGAY